MRNFKRIITVILSTAILFGVCYVPLSLIITASGNQAYTVEYLNKDGEGTDITSKELAALGTSLIAGQRAIPYAYDVNTDTHTNIWLSSNVNGQSLNDAANVLAGLTDGNITTAHQFYYFGGNGISAMDLEYDLGVNTTVDKFLFISRQAGAAYVPRYTAAYDVYLADTKANLYKAENKIYSYNYETDGIANGQIVTFNEKSQGRYLAIRITRPWYTSTSYNYPRLTEIAVYGEAAKTDATYSVTYLNKDGEGTDMTSKELAALGTSLIAGQRAIPYAYDVNTDTHTNIWLSSNVSGQSLNDAANVLAGLTDGNITTAHQFYYFGGNGISAMDLEYDLGVNTTVDKFLFISRQAGEAYVPRYAAAYDVYLADTKADLYKDENKIYSYNCETDGIANGQIVTFNEKSQGRYLAIRITRPWYTSTTYNYPRLTEIAVYGEAAEAAEYTVNYLDEQSKDDFMTNEQLAALGESLIEKKQATPYEYLPETDTHKKLIGNTHSDPETAKRMNLENSNAVLSALTDGDLTASVTPKIFGASASPDITEFVYDFGELCNINKFLMIGYSNFAISADGIWTRQLYTGAYEVYLSDTEEELYKAENMIYSYNKDSDGITRGQIVSFTEAKQGRYLAVRITNPVSNTNQTKLLRLSEIAVYGDLVNPKNYKVEYIAEKESDYKTPNMYSNEQFKALGENLLLNAEPIMRSNGTTNTQLSSANNGKINDGDVENGVIINTWIKPTYGDPTMDIIYELGEEPIEIEKFFFLGFAAPWRHYYTGKYQVFIAEEYDELFLKENMVYEYDYKTQQVSRGQIVSFNDHPVGCYFAIRIIEPNIVEYDNNAEPWICPKLSEIALYGKKAEIVQVPVNLADNKPVNAYLTDNDGTLKEIEEKDFGAEDASKLTDGDLTEEVVFKNSKKKLNLVYNLCRNMQVDEINVSSSTGAESFTIYASDDINDVWNESAKVYEYKANGSRTLTNGITFSDSRSMRYVRVSFDGDIDKVAISEVEIIGLSLQQLKYKKISGSIKTTAVQVYTQNRKTGEKSYIEVEPTDLAKLFDGETVAPVGLEGGNPDTDTLELVFYLGDLRIVDSIELSFFEKIAQYRPGALSVYVGESEQEVTGKDAKPLYSFDYSAVSYKLDLKPRLARYIRVSVTKYAPDDYDSYCVGFTEIKIMGSSVVGTQTDRNNDVLTSFKDRSTGIEWEIVRFDSNDILTEVSDSYLVTSSVNKDQKASLYDLLYKIVDEKAYQIVFTDRTGKVIDGLNGRTVRVKVPSKLTSGVNETLMGTAVDSGVELCETIVSDDGYSYIYAEFSGLSGHFILAAPTTAEDSYWNGIIVKTDTTDDTEADTSDDLYDDYSFSTVTNSETTDTDNETESTDTTPNKVKKHKKVAHVIEGYEAWVLPVIIVSCVLGAAAVVFVILLIVKKKKKIR